MPIDASIYQNIRPVEIPSPLDAAQKGMALSQLGMQQMQMSRQMQTQQAVQGAYGRNMDQNGNLDKGGFLSDLAKVSPMAAMDYKNQFIQQDKQQAEAKAAQLDAAQKAVGIAFPAMDYLAGLPENQRAAAYPNVMKQIGDQGVDISQMPHEYDPGHFRQTYMISQKMKPALESALAQAEIAQKYADIGMAPAKRNAELYGSRSPNAELTSQYSKEPSTSIARSSQVAMGQMIDNYQHPSPQGDASLILNAFKIKFPTAPDVNSLEELSKSQAASDTWKNVAHKALSGGLDQPTRDNLLRDGISTFRANVGSLQDTQAKYQARARQQNVNDPTMTSEPAIDKTYADAMALQKNIGPYKPPSERGGVMAGINKFASKLIGGSGEQSAAADQKPQYRQAGATVSGDEVAQYAHKHNLTVSDAQKALKGFGYAIGR